VRNARHWFESIPDDHPSRLMFGGGARGGGGDDDSPLIEFHHNTLMSPESMVCGLWLRLWRAFCFLYRGLILQFSVSQTYFQSVILNYYCRAIAHAPGHGLAGYFDASSRQAQGWRPQRAAQSNQKQCVLSPLRVAGRCVQEHVSRAEYVSCHFPSSRNKEHKYSSFICGTIVATFEFELVSCLFFFTVTSRLRLFPQPGCN
jgi:hypothetical protein